MHPPPSSPPAQVSPDWSSTIAYYRGQVTYGIAEVMKRLRHPFIHQVAKG
jgi:hypothetical protein